MSKTATNDHTGAKLVSKVSTDEYRKNFERIFIRNNDAPAQLKPVPQAVKDLLREVSAPVKNVKA